MLISRTTSGKPILAAAIMAGLLALAAAAAWSVSYYRAHQPIELGPRQPLGDSATIAPPAGWTINPPSENAIADFAEPAGAMQTRRLLVYYEQADSAVSPSLLIRRKQLGPMSFSAGFQIGPLPACQTLVISRERENLTKDLVRVAVMGPREFLILRLLCVGPPTDYEVNLLDQVARSVQLDPNVYLPADKRARQVGLRLTGQTASWLAPAQAQPANTLVLLPVAGGKSGGSGFWGAVRIRKEYALPGVDLGRLLADRRVADPLARLFRRPVEPDEWSFAPEANEPDQADGGSLPAAEQRKVAGLTVWQVRHVDHDRHVVRLRFAFRPILFQAGAAPESAGPQTAPGSAKPQPAAVSSNRAIVLDAWADLADEQAATAAIDELIPSVRLPLP